MRTFSRVAYGLTIAVLWAGTAQAQDEIVAEFPKFRSPPVIDGVADEMWDHVQGHDNEEFFEIVGEDELDGEEDLSVVWKAAWDDENLYVFAEVIDDEIIIDEQVSWEDDSFEIYIDAQNTDEPEFNPNNFPEVPAYQFTIVAGTEMQDDSTSAFTWGINSYDGDDEVTQYPQGADTSVSVLNEETNTYTVEVAFPWEALEETPASILERGDEGFGFGIAINDDDDGASRDTQLMWMTEAGDLWHVASSFPSVGLSTEVVPPMDGTPGDYNGDDELTAADIDLLAGAIGTDDATYDVNEDGTVDLTDHSLWVSDLKKTWIGDANLDGQFDSGDFVTAFTIGKYETGDAAGWEAGDWNADGLFNSADFVAAFSEGGYNQGPRAATAAVPEPSAFMLLGIGLLGLARRRR